MRMYHDVATCTDYAGMAPSTKKQVRVAKAIHACRLQRKPLPFFKPAKYFTVQEGLTQASRADLIVGGCDCPNLAQPPEGSGRGRVERLHPDSDGRQLSRCRAGKSAKARLPRAFDSSNTGEWRLGRRIIEYCWRVAVYRDPRCVFVAESLAQAEAVIGWLGGADIAATVIEENTLGGLDGLNIFTGVGARGWEVWVDQPDAAERARQLIADFEATRKAEQESRTGTVDVTCEECGASTTFAATELGTIQDCPKCGAMVDVPDPADDWDVGDPEEAVEE